MPAAADFQARAKRFEDDPAVVYVLGPDLRLLYCNAAWDRFALANDGPLAVREFQVGRLITEVIPPILREFYLAAYQRIWTTGEHWDHDLECPSSEVLRRIHMHVAPLSGCAHPAPLVVVDSLRVEISHPAPRAAGEPGAYRNENGFITMCCHCRRTERPWDPLIWDWVPDFVSDLPDEVTHGLCPPCLRIHYPA